MQLSLSINISHFYRSFTYIHNYNIAGSARGRYEADHVFWLATRASEMGISRFL